jgi:hypothetical protein
MLGDTGSEGKRGGGVDKQLLLAGTVTYETIRGWIAPLPGSVAVKGLSRSLRQEGAPYVEVHKLIIAVWRRNLDLK